MKALFNKTTSRLIAVALLVVFDFPSIQGRSGATLGNRPEAAGDLDPFFGNGGKQTTDFFSNQDAADAVAIQSDGKIVLAGYAQHGNDSSSTDFAVARYNADGTLDQTFGVGGKQATDFFGYYDQANGVAIQPDGKIVVAGLASHNNDFASIDFALARYNPEGTLDQSFGSGGKQTTDFFGAQDEAGGVAIQSDGKIVLAGHAAHSQSVSLPSFALARYNADGTLDQTFGTGGKQTTDFPGSTSLALGLIIQGDAKIVVVGNARPIGTPAASDFAVARYNQDGTIDQSFGWGGKQTTDFFGYSDTAWGVAVQRDGKIVAAGVALHGIAFSTADFALARYNQDGTLDQSFGSGGKQATDFFGHADQPFAVAIQSDGKIVVAGYCYPTDNSSTSDFALARYNSDGTPDQSFGSGGKQTTGFFGGLDGADSVAIQPDGRIVLAGYAQHGSGASASDFALARYSTDPDFSIAFSQSSLITQAGTKIPATLLISRVGGFTGNVTVTPPDPSMGIKPKPPGPVTITGDSAVFKMKVGGGVPPGSYDRTFTAADDSGRNRTATLTIVVQP